MNFAMTGEEILRSFNEAKHPSRQVSVLADLNATDVPTMCAKLKELGVDYKRLPRQKKEKAETTAAPAAPEEQAPPWKTVFRELGEKQAACSARMDEIENQLAALQSERRRLHDQICDIGTSLDVLLQVYENKETDNA